MPSFGPGVLPSALAKANKPLVATPRYAPTSIVVVGEFLGILTQGVGDSSPELRIWDLVSSDERHLSTREVR